MGLGQEHQSAIVYEEMVMCEEKSKDWKGLQDRGEQDAKE